MLNSAKVTFSTPKFTLDVHISENTIFSIRKYISETVLGEESCLLTLTQLLAEGPKYMQIGGLILKIERTAEGIVHIPSPHIKPEATAPA